MNELICICCPLGCHLSVKFENGEYEVTGNTCPRGKKYAIEEMTAPTRTVTASVKITGSTEKMLSVKTDKPIAKELIFKSLELLKTVSAKAPVNIGDVVLGNVLGTGVNFVATKNIR